MILGRQIETDLGLKQNIASNPLEIKPLWLYFPSLLPNFYKPLYNPNSLIQVSVYKALVILAIIYTIKALIFAFRYLFVFILV